MSDQRLTSFDRERAMQFGALSEQLHIVAAASEGLRDQTQQLSSALRTPSVVVRLPGGRAVIVDAKAPLTAYLDASTETNDRDRLRLFRAHAAQLRVHVDALARKAYWELLGPGTTPEFVVLFLPGEAFFSAALEHDPALLDDSAARGVQAPELVVSQTTDPGSIDD